MGLGWGWQGLAGGPVGRGWERVRLVGGLKGAGRGVR